MAVSVGPMVPTGDLDSSLGGEAHPLHPRVLPGLPHASGSHDSV